MKKIILFKFMIIGLVSLITLGCDKYDLEVTPKQQNFSISLPATPSTGFQWTIIEYDKSIFEPVSAKYNSSKDRVPGARGEMIFVFNILKKDSYPKSSILKFKYSRSWEPATATYKEIMVHIK